MSQNKDQPMSRSRLINMWTDKFTENGRFSYEIAGKTALFTDPTTGCGGEKCSMEIPSYSAIEGLTKEIFWKPAINIIVDRVRVMNVIAASAEGQKLLGLDGRTDRAFYTYLRNVRYQVEAHIEFNKLRPQFSAEWGNPKKYYAEMVKGILMEGRRVPFLGKSECIPEYIRICDFGEGPGYYDNSGEKRFGYLYWGLTYPDTGYDRESLSSIMTNIWDAKMVDGIITYPKPEECLRRKIRDADMKYFPDIHQSNRGGKKHAAS